MVPFLSLSMDKTVNQRVVTSEELIKLIALLSGQDGSVTPSTKLGDAIALDSLEKVKLASQIETVFGIEICESSIDDSLSIEAFLEVLNEHQSEQDHLRVKTLNFSMPVRVMRFVLQTALLPFLRIFYPVTVVGDQYLEIIDSPHIFAINHTSHLDTPTFTKAMPFRIRRKLAFAAAADVFYAENGRDTLPAKLKRRFYEVSLNIFPFSRKVSLRKSIDNCIQVLQMGYHVCIYPESKRTLDGNMLEFKSGVGILAHTAQVPVVPVRIDGLFEVLPKGRKLPQFGKVTIRIGKPFIVDDRSYGEIAHEIRERVKDL